MSELITPTQEEAASQCLRRHIPFALYALPGQKECVFMASLPDTRGCSPVSIGDDSDSRVFFISRFASDEPYTSGVKSEMDDEALISFIAANPGFMLRGASERPSVTSTRQVSYREAFTAIKNRLKKVGGKSVLSRHKAIMSSRDIIEVADDYFDRTPHAFRYLSFTPETGIWLGATPELLLEHTAGSGYYRTMALAGTRPSDNSLTGVWDEKNILEHSIVVDFISSRLTEAGLNVETEPRRELRAGNVSHLCTLFHAYGPKDALGTLLASLNPTPAVAGWPRDVALTEIDLLETHMRRCYSGIVGVRENGILHAYVNLRCAFASRATLDDEYGWLYNLYAGGGIMPESDIDTEWAETEQKMHMLTSCIVPSGNARHSFFIINPVEAEIEE